MHGSGADLLVNDEQTAQRHPITCEHVVLAGDFTLQVRDQRVGKIPYPALLAVCTPPTSSAG